MTDAEILKANFELGFTYTRSTGPIIGHFLSKLQECQIMGIKGSDNKVIVPPPEFDPETGERLSEFVQVSNTGTVSTWVWVSYPLDKHPIQSPFAWAFIKLEGADTNFLHAVKVKNEKSMKNNMKVKAVWALPPKGNITDIKYFEPI